MLESGSRNDDTAARSALWTPSDALLDTQYRSIVLIKNRDESLRYSLLDHDDQTPKYCSFLTRTLSQCMSKTVTPKASAFPSPIVALL